MHNSVHLSYIDCIKQDVLGKSLLTSLSCELCYVLGEQKALKNTFQATIFKVGENSRTFQKLVQTFKDFIQGKMEFKDLSMTSPKIQRLFKTLRTLKGPKSSSIWIAIQY